MSFAAQSGTPCFYKCIYTSPLLRNNYFHKNLIKGLDKLYKNKNKHINGTVKSTRRGLNRKIILLK